MSAASPLGSRLAKIRHESQTVIKIAPTTKSDFFNLRMFSVAQEERRKIRKRYTNGKMAYIQPEIVVNIAVIRVEKKNKIAK